VPKGIDTLKVPFPERTLHRDRATMHLHQFVYKRESNSTTFTVRRFAPSIPRNRSNRCGISGSAIPVPVSRTASSTCAPEARNLTN
jgi:hypothetical protein